MRRFYAFQTLFWTLGLTLCAQTINVGKPSVIPTQEKYKAVEASNLLHAIEGSAAVYKVAVVGFDSIESVTSLICNDTKDFTSSCHLEKGVLTIDDITISALEPNEAPFDLRISLTARDKGRVTDSTYTDVAPMSIKVYPTPTGKEVDRPNYLKYYKDTETDLTWTFKGKGGYKWDCTWTIDNKDSKNNPYVQPRITGQKNTILKLTAKNVAPDGNTEWDQYEESWEIVVFPEATTKFSTPYKKELFQDQEWPLSVSVNGGYDSGWEYSWLVNKEKINVHTDSYTLAIGENERSSETIIREVKLTVKNNLPGDTKIPTNAKLEWSQDYIATFYYCPVVRFAENYPQNILDGDDIQFKFVILDNEGNSLMNNPDYHWDYKWTEDTNVSTNTTYLLNGKNLTNTDGKTHVVKCNISGKLKGIEQTYSKTLTHSVTVWPKPKVFPLTKSDYVSCGGHPITVEVETFGGQKTGWEYYYGKDGEALKSSKDNPLAILVTRDAERSELPNNEEYTLIVKNYVEGTVRCSDTLTISVDVYPAPWTPNDIIIVDRNRNNASATIGIREGNEIILSCEECYGGYPTGWRYYWNKDYNNIGYDNEILDKIDDVYSGDTKDDSRTVVYNCYVYNYYVAERWEAKEDYKKQLTIYNKPQTPASLTKKGNGTSGTMIATTSVSDTDLEGHEYYLVFGYYDGNGQMHDATSQRQQNVGEVRWSTQISSSEMGNTSNKLYVYALWKYNNGIEITSGLRFLNGIDEYWDGSSYSGVTRAVIANTNAIENIDYKADMVTPKEYYSINGVKSQSSSKGFNIVKMSDGSVRKIMIK